MVSHAAIASVVFGAALPAAAQTTAPVQLPTLQVEGQPAPSEYQAPRMADPRYSEPLRNTPQTINVIPQKVLEERNVTSLRDALRTVPGISMTAGEGGGAQGDALRVRGYVANTDLFLDGMRDIAQYNRDPFNIERIEVVKGGSGNYFGRGTTGGFINQVSKEPSMTPSYGGVATLGTDETKRLTTDVNIPLNKAVGSWALGGAALRINTLLHEGDVAERNVVTNERWGIAPSLSVGLGTPTRATLSYVHFESDGIADYGLPLIDNRVPTYLNRKNWYGFKDLNTEEVTSDMVTAKIEHDFNNDLTLTNKTRYGRTSRKAIVTPPRTPNVAADTVTRNPTGRDNVTEVTVNQTDVTARFNTGFLRHTLVAGVEIGVEDFRNQALAFAGAPIDSLFNPNPNTPFTGTRSLGTKTDTKSKSIGAFAIDTVKIGEQFEVIAGARWDRVDTDNTTKDAAGVVTKLSRVDEEPSWRAAVVWKPLPYGSVYASYGTSFNPSAESLSLANNTANLDPEKNTTYEIGTKWDVLSGKLSLTGAIFRIEKENARTPGLTPADPPQVLDGKQRVDGFEIGFAGNITKDWAIYGGYTFLKSEIIESNTPAEVGKEFQNTPEHSFALWTTYELPWNFQIGFGAQYVGERWTSNTNVAKVPDYWVFDAMLAYHLTENIDIRLNVYNLTNEFYVDRIHPAHLVPGPGLTAYLSTAVKF